MNQQAFCKKYGDGNSVQQIILRKAYRNYFTNKKRDSSVRASREIACTRLGSVNKSMQVGARNTSRVSDNEISMMSQYQYNQMKDKLFNDNDRYLIENMKTTKQRQEMALQQLQLDQQRIHIQQQHRQQQEQLRKLQFYREAELHKLQQTERKLRIYSEQKQEEDGYCELARRNAVQEQHEQLEQRIMHRQKCRIQYEMLERQRKLNQQLL